MEPELKVIVITFDVNGISLIVENSKRTTSIVPISNEMAEALYFLTKTELNDQ